MDRIGQSAQSSQVATQSAVKARNRNEFESTNYLLDRG
jgi:hypothetical protein